MRLRLDSVISAGYCQVMELARKADYFVAKVSAKGDVGQTLRDMNAELRVDKENNPNAPIDLTFELKVMRAFLLSAVNTHEDDVSALATWAKAYEAGDTNRVPPRDFDRTVILIDKIQKLAHTMTTINGSVPKRLFLQTMMGMSTIINRHVTDLPTRMAIKREVLQLCGGVCL